MVFSDLNCIFPANNSGVKLNLNPFNQTVILASIANLPISYIYNPCQVSYFPSICGSGMVLSSIEVIPFEDNGASNDYNCYDVIDMNNNGLLTDIQYDPQLEIWNLSYSGDGESSDITAYIYWICDHTISSHSIVEVGILDKIISGYARKMQIKIASQYACIHNEKNFELKSWLIKLDLMQYYDAFIKEEFDENDISAVSMLTDAQLKELGVNKMGHRNKIRASLNHK